MEDMESIAFQIISSVGSARSNYIAAIQKAKAGDFERAEKLMEEGGEMFLEGHRAHAKLLQEDAGDTAKGSMSLLLIHAEDQLMSAEAFKTVAREFIDVYRRVEKLENK